MSRLLLRRLVLSAVVIAASAGPSWAQAQMPNAREMSGKPRPDTTVPVGSVTVRVVRGGFDKNVTNHPVTFSVDGVARVVNTDGEGRALLSGLRPNSSVQAETTVDGERLQSETFVIGGSGIRVALVATDPADAARAAEDKALAAAPAVSGIVVLGPESRVILELGEGGLNVFYEMDILNSARSRVDIGRPLIFELPTGARGTSFLEGSSPQATANGPRVIVTGPFAPGSTMVRFGFEVPYRGSTARLDQTWPATLQHLTMLVQQHGALEIASPQIESKTSMMSQAQVPFTMANGPAIPAGKALSLELSGLPNHPEWPRWLALALGLGFVGLGLWAGFTGPARRRI